MAFAAIKEKANALFEVAPYISSISSEVEYREAQELIEDLFEEYDQNRHLIDLVVAAIEEWESNSSAFSEFNARISGLGGVDALVLLMEQHNLGMSDLPEIGSKSLVSRIVSSRDRKLTVGHIQALSRRFGVSPVIFI